MKKELNYKEVKSLFNKNYLVYYLLGMKKYIIINDRTINIHDRKYHPIFLFFGLIWFILSIVHIVFNTITMFIKKLENYVLEVFLPDAEDRNIKYNNDWCNYIKNK